MIKESIKIPPQKVTNKHMNGLATKQSKPTNILYTPRDTTNKQTLGLVNVRTTANYTNKWTQGITLCIK